MSTPPSLLQPRRHSRESGNPCSRRKSAFAGKTRFVPERPVGVGSRALRPRRQPRRPDHSFSAIRWRWSRLISACRSRCAPWFRCWKQRSARSAGHPWIRRSRSDSPCRPHPWRDRPWPPQAHSFQRLDRRFGRCLLLVVFRPENRLGIVDEGKLELLVCSRSDLELVSHDAGPPLVKTRKD